MFLEKGKRAIIGSKAYDLYKCRLLDVKVPEFYVIPTEVYRRYVSNGGKIEKRLVKELRTVFFKLGGSVAVRSSSVAEDTQTRSNAGKFKTVLNVRSISHLISAVKTVWSSGISEADAEANAEIDADGNDEGDRDGDSHEMAVIIQEQLSPEHSGVLFSRNPVNGENETVIEYVTGLGESLVSGIQTPTRVVVENRSLNIEDQPEGSLPFKELIHLSEKLETNFGYPLDIEWAQCGGDFYILQARPITHLLPPAKEKGRTYSRVQAEQFFSGPVSPLFYSIFKKLYLKNYLQDTIKSLQVNLELDEETLVRHKNYLYVDTAFYEFALDHLPVRSNRNRLLEIFPEDIRDELKNKKGRTDPKESIKILKFLITHPKYWVTNLDTYFTNKVAPKIIYELDELKNFEQMTESELFLSFQRLLDISVLHIRTSKWGLGLYSMPLVEAMGKFLEKNGLDKRHLLTLVSGLEINKTLDASKELHRLTEIVRRDRNKSIYHVLSKELDDYSIYKKELEKTPDGQKVIDYFELTLKRFGHRRLSRDILKPSWNDEPMIPFSILRRLVFNNNGRTNLMIDTSKKKRSLLEQQIKRQLPAAKRWFFKTLSKYMVRYIGFRELQRFYLDMIVSKMRHLFLEISHRMVNKGIISEPGDIFFLELSDVEGYLWGISKLNLEKKAEFNKLSFETDQRSPGRYMRLGVDFDSISCHKPGFHDRYTNNRRKILGEPVSPGCFHGRVRIIEDVDDKTEIEPNDIVVTRCIDPGQTHVFLLAGALVIEVGGMLSHGAILAREFELPTVAQVKNATRILKNNQLITVNGTKGEIIFKAGGR